MTPGSIVLLALAIGPEQGSAPWSTPAAAEAIVTIDRGFEEYRLDAHVPGLVYGIVVDGRLRTWDARRAGPRDAAPRLGRHAVPDRVDDQGVHRAHDPEAPRRRQLALDAPAETYVPELRDWKYPTEDSPRIRVRDLLNHTAGLRHRRSVGRPPDAAARRGLHAAAARRRAVHARARARRSSTRTWATRCSGASSRTSRGGRTRTTSSTRCCSRSAWRRRVSRPTRRRASGARSAIAGRTTVATGADAGARRVRRDGRAADQRQRLCEVGGVAAVGVAGARRRDSGAGEARDGARARARLELPACGMRPATTGDACRRRRLRHGHDRRGRLRSRLHASTAAVIRATVARAAAARSRRRHLRVREPHLRRPVAAVWDAASRSTRPAWLEGPRRAVERALAARVRAVARSTRRQRHAAGACWR